MICITCGKEIEEDSPGLFECRSCAEMEIIEKDKFDIRESLNDIFLKHHNGYED